MYGYWCKALRVDLTTQTYRAEDIPEETMRKLVGGGSLGAKILLEETPANVNPFSPENKLIFAVGPLQGTNFPGNGKWSVITKGPLTGTFLDSAGTGHWAPFFKKTGYDLVIFEGKAPKPVYVFINDEGVQFRDAFHLWGKDTVETGECIKEELGDKRINALNIGPAGEMLNPVACITCDGHSFAGRGGAGAVMGSKNLKAVAAWGTKEVPVKDREKADEYSKKIFKQLHEQGAGFRQHGTPVVMVPLQEIGDVPIKYWRGDVWKRGAGLIGAPRYTDYLKVKPLPCINCPVGCHRHIHYEFPNGDVLEGNGPEYETIGMMGSSLLVEDLPAICLANDYCNRMGMDTVSTGAWVGFLMECYEYGWLTPEQLKGMEIRWGDGKVLLELCKQICRLEGLGALFREGIRGAAKAVGREAEQIIVHAKGLDYPAHDPRAVFGLGVNYATATRGACHERGNPQATALGLFYPELGLDGPPDRFSVEEAAKCAFIMQNTSTLYNNLTLCKFMVGGAGLTLTEITTAVNHITGWDVEPAELVHTAERGFTLQRLVNVRDGIRRKDDTLAPKMTMPALVGGRAGKTPTPHDKILDDYYALRGWNADGVPTAETLKSLGLEEFIRFLP